MKSSMRKVRDVLERRKQWERLYPPDYIKRFFTLYDGELEALLEMARKKNDKNL